MKAKLKIGILLNSDNIPAWSYKMLEEIIKGNYAEIVLVVKNKSFKYKTETSKVKKVFKNLDKLFFSLYGIIDRKMYKVSPDAFSRKNINDLINADRIEVVPKQTIYSDKISEKDILKIKDYNVDIFIRMGFRILRGEILTVAKYGVWSYHHGDNSVNRGGPPGFWEVYQKWNETGVILQILSEDLDNGTILFKSFSNTISKSLVLNNNNYYWKAVSFMPNKMKELYEIGEIEFFERVKELNSNPEFYYNPLYQNKNISKAGLVNLIFSNLFNILKNKIKNLIYLHQGILLFKLNTTETMSKSFFRFQKMIPSKDRSWYNPFIVSRNDNYFIFISEVLHNKTKGHISVITMDKKGNYSEPVKVLETDYNLSYPFLIEEAGNLYMIPETIQNNSIDLYKCVDFPTKWDFEKSLIKDIQAINSTITFKDNYYWLFANVVSNKGASALDELHIFSAQSLFSDKWIAHPKNPVISDVKQSCPAGNFFNYNNNLYRPSQNNSKHHGHGLKINRVIELNKEIYREETVNSIFPNWQKDIKAVHTLNSTGKLTVIDAKLKRRR